MRLPTIVFGVLLVSASACQSPGSQNGDTPLLGIGTSPAGVGTSPKPIKSRVTLTAVGSDVDATGFAQIMLHDRGGTLVLQTVHIQVHRLAPRTMYHIVLDGTELDAFTTNAGGAFEAKYEPDPKGSHRLLPAVQTPVTNIKLIEIKDASGQVVLSGTVGAEEEGEDEEEAECEFALAPTSVDPDAKGEAEIEVETEDGVTEQEFSIEVENLASSSSFKLFIDGVEIATFTTDASGKAKVVFSSDPEGSEQPLPSSINLANAKLIEVKDSSGQVVLTGTKNC